MRRLPIALILATTIALMVTVPIRYIPLPANETFEYVCYYGGLTTGHVNLYANVNMSKIPSVIYIRSSAAITSYDKFGREHEIGKPFYIISDVINNTILVYKLIDLPKYTTPFEVKLLFKFNVSRVPVEVYISTDGKHWVRVSRC